MLKNLLICLVLASWPATPAWSQEPADDVESDFYSEDETPPAEEPLPIEQDPEVERSESPDDEGIEYADEAEKTEAEEQAKRQEQLNQNQLRRNRPPIDEPMPLIRRQRETVEFPNKTPPKKIRHPFAAKGLTKITRDGTYIYKVKTSDQTRASSMKFGLFSPTKLENKDTGAIYEDFYDTGNPALLYDYEWQFFRKVGKLGFKLGTGVAMASGNGRFKNDGNLTGQVEPKEKFTFVTIPNSAGLILRLQFTEDQIIVPYAEGGGVGFIFGEFRDDGDTPKGGAAFGAYAAAGVAFSLDFLDRISMLELDREYSINSVYLTAEYRQYVGFGNFNFSSELINGGVTLEF